MNVELVITDGPGVMIAHAIVDRARAMVYVEAISEGMEVIMSPTDKSRRVFHG